MNRIVFAALACTALTTVPAAAQEARESSPGTRSEIVVIGAAEASAGTKTDTPLVETPQPISIVPDEVYLAQGALSVSDTLNYVAGVTASPYGPDSRVDGGFIRGIAPLQFRDGMRDLYSYYASIRSDPYNFSRVEVVRGPASVLFGAGSIGGLVNLVSKAPQETPAGEVAVRYGSFDRFEVLGDVTGALAPGLSARMVARVRDAGTQVDYVEDDRVMLAPSLRMEFGPATELTVLGLYQEDDSGSTSQFLPAVGTILPNPNGQLPNDRFIGKPGWDRYDGRLLEGTAILDHRFSEAARLNLKARIIDSDVTYFTHYPNSYSHPRNPYIQLDPTGAPVLDPVTGQPLPDPEQRTIGLYADGSYATMDVFSTDNNVQFDFTTGSAVAHTLLAGVDYSWNRVRKTSGFAVEAIDIYDPNYDLLSDWDGGLPNAAFASTTDTRGEQLGFYLQDQVRLWDRVSVVLGARHDDVRTRAVGGATESDDAWSFRAGIIGELVRGVSPFFSYTESFEPVSGTTSDGSPFVPKRGRQYELGVKFHPDAATLVTVTAFDILESNRPVSDDSTPDPRDQIQAGEAFSRGFEIEASRTLPGDYTLIAAYSYNEAEIEGTGQQLNDVPEQIASLWGTKTLPLGSEASLRLGAGVRHVGEHRSYGPAFPDGLVTPSYTLVDALAEIDWRNWRLSVNATNLFDEQYYASCLARGDCFIGAERNVFATLGYRF
ncbi:TonB-dependent siderophore receptor [Sphingosinithalassobacter sp. CS137]|uniref:TonB-dependent siderophore receptor n=1 Tax=Sphingosinithalassobacter sp. CS137 TaxID=2762748 RepID=UPI00165D8A5B|nr:TonB-dependent siderophore receptor [Sphingosinithalassobacter sp. CS137]